MYKCWLNGENMDTLWLWEIWMMCNHITCTSKHGCFDRYLLITEQTVWTVYMVYELALASVICMQIMHNLTVVCNEICEKVQQYSHCSSIDLQLLCATRYVRRCRHMVTLALTYFVTCIRSLSFEVSCSYSHINHIKYSKIAGVLLTDVIPLWPWLTVQCY